MSEQMQRQLYPSALAEDTIESHRARHSSPSQAIYLAVVLLFLAACAALPLLRVSVSVQSGGIIRPETEKHEVRSRVSGLAAEVRVREGQSVRRGDVIAVLRSAAVDERGGLLAEQAAEKQRALADLELLTRPGAPLAADLSRFQTSNYRQEYVQLADELRENRVRREKARKDLDRARELHARSFATAAEVDEKQFQFDQAEAEGALTGERYRAKWQASLASLRLELKELVSRRRQLDEERALHTLTAPVAGTVEEISGVSPGSFVRAGERLAVISPASRLVAEVYVTPRDIGLIRPGAPVRLLVDAFNYHDWGFVAGRVAEISGDFVLVGSQPMFKVKCAMDRDRLALRNGFTGHLKKGMTLRARFIVAERSLFQLLYDDVDDWLNPVQAPLPSARPVIDGPADSRGSNAHDPGAPADG